MTQATLTHDAPSTGDRYTAKEVLAAGALMGALAGALMLACLMIDAALHQTNPITPLQLFGAPFFSPEARAGGAAAVLPGMLLHLLVSAALGLPFAALVPRDFPVAGASVLGIGSRSWSWPS
jgi:hypothetical protein